MPVRPGTLRTVRLTSEAWRRLRQSRGSGRVHSAFARTVNVELHGLGDRRWVSLHGPGAIPSPFGIACEPAPPPAGLEGAPVRVDAEALVLAGCLRIDLRGARVVDTALPARAPLPPVFPSIMEALASAAGGLFPAVVVLLADGVPPTDPLSRAALPALVRLSRATSARDPSECLAAARRLVGLGPGLTPAGDDCLVGWLAGVLTAGGDGRGLVEAVGPDLLEAARDGTGELSRAFLTAAVLGVVAEPVHAFVLAPDAARLPGLLALGATSGADLLAGYLLARSALTPGAVEARPWR